MKVTPKILWLITIVLAGCSDTTLSTSPVRGVVLLDGNTLDHGDVVSMALAGRMGKGEIQSDGTFEISTYDEGGGDGAILGPTRVAVICDAPQTQKVNRYDEYWGGGQGSVVPENFNSPHTSGLDFEVSDKPNEIRILLSSDGSGIIETK